MADIQTTGGVLTDENREVILANICKVFSCDVDDIENLEPVQAGLTNVVLSFRLNGGRYVYRHPGLDPDMLLERGRETIMQKVVEEAGIDTTLVAMDVDEGWRIGRFVEHRDFDYGNLNDMVRAMMLFRRLHAAPARVRWNFDVVQKVESVRDQIPPEEYAVYPDLEAVEERVYRLVELSEGDGVNKCNIHGDSRDVNFLINDEEIYLIDWEYGGYGDPGLSIGSYVNGGQHTFEDIDRILFTYFRRKPTEVQRRHFLAYIAITGWFYMYWTATNLYSRRPLGTLREQWYHYARNYSLIALPMYGVEVDQTQLAAAIEAAKACKLEDLHYMDIIAGKDVR